MPFYQFDASGLVKRYVELILRHPLRAYDGIQLATAVIINRSLIAHSLPPLVFISADDTLIAAAQAEGLTVDNPN